MEEKKETKIRITLAVRKTYEVSDTLEVTPEEYERLLNGDNPFYGQMEALMDKDPTPHYDYAVLDEAGENYAVDWS